MPTSGTDGTRADLERTKQGTIPIYTDKMGQQTQASAGESNQVDSNKNGITHNDEN